MSKDPPKSLFVTNLPYSLDLEDFKSYFTKFGPVERFDIPDHPNKPIAFVHFINSEDAAKCLKENNGILYQGKILRIKFSSKAKPEHAPPLPPSIKADHDNTSDPSGQNANKPDFDDSKRNDHELHKKRYDNIYNDWDDRRRNHSPEFEVDRRRDHYSKYDYIDQSRERYMYRDRDRDRDRIIRNPPMRERELDYYDDYHRSGDYYNYHHHHRSSDHRDREMMHDYHERDIRDARDHRDREIRERDYYDYQYSQPPIQPRQIPQSQIPQTLPYNASQNSPIISSQSSANPSQPTIPSQLEPIPAIPQQPINDMMQMPPRPQMIRSQLQPPPTQMQTPPRMLQDQITAPRVLPPSSGIPQSQQQQYDFNENRYYANYR